MVASFEQITASSASPQVIDNGLGREALPGISGELERVVADLVQKALSNPALWPKGPSPTPVFTFGPFTPPLEADELEKRLGEIPLVVENETLQGNQSSSDTISAIKSSAPQAQSKSDTEDEKRTSAAKPRASVLGFKKAMEMWDKDTSKYKIVESIETDDVIDDLDQYVFVVRQHVDKHNKEVTSYIDVKSGPLREILRDVLQGVKAVSVMEDKPSIKEDILFHFLHELCEYMEKLHGDAGSYPTQLVHLTILVNRIQDTYSATTEHLASLLQHGEITYDLLWALFKPGCHVYTKCFGTEKPRCVIFDAGGEITAGGVTYYELECRYLDYDGEVFGDANIHSGIVKFCGSKPISALNIDYI